MSNMHLHPHTVLEPQQEADVSATAMPTRVDSMPTRLMLSLKQSVFLVVILTSLAASGIFLATAYTQPQALQLVRTFVHKAPTKLVQSTLPFIFHKDVSEDRFRMSQHAQPLVATSVSNVAGLHKNALIGDIDGRPDPFRPLVQEDNGTAAPVEEVEEKRDVLDSLQYIGMIDDRRPSERVALIQVTDPISGHHTAIKKTGERLKVEDSTIIIQGVQQNSLTLSVNGVRRQMRLNPYLDSAQNKTAGAGAAPTGDAPKVVPLKDGIKKSAPSAKPTLDDLEE